MIAKPHRTSSGAVILRPDPLDFEMGVREVSRRQAVAELMAADRRGAGRKPADWQGIRRSVAAGIIVILEVLAIAGWCWFGRK